MGGRAVFLWRKGGEVIVRVFSVFDGYTTELQRRIIAFMNEQAKKVNKPISLSCVVNSLSKEGIPVTTIKASVRSLESNGYIRRSIPYTSRASYVMQRTA